MKSNRVDVLGLLQRESEDLETSCWKTTISSLLSLLLSSTAQWRRKTCPSYFPIYFPGLTAPAVIWFTLLPYIHAWHTWMSGTERPLCTSLSRVVLNTTKFSFLLLLTSSPALLNMRINVCLKITPNLRWSSTRVWNGTQLFSGTLLNSKVTMLPTKKSDSKRLFMEQMGN